MSNFRTFPGLAAKISGAGEESPEFLKEPKIP